MLARRALATVVAVRAMSSVPTPGNPADFWNSRYGADEYAYGKAPNKWVEEAHARLPAGGAVVDLGCGEGRNAAFLAAKGFKVTAVDFAAEGVAKTARLASELGVKLEGGAHVGDATRWQPSEPVDGVVSVFLHVPPPQKPALFGNIVQMLRPGGLLIAEWYTPEQVIKAYGTGGPPVAAACISKDELASALGAHGTFDVLEETTYEVHEGVHHNGTGAVVRVVWQKAEMTQE